MEKHQTYPLVKFSCMGNSSVEEGCNRKASVRICVEAVAESGGVCM